MTSKSIFGAATTATKYISTLRVGAGSVERPMDEPRPNDGACIRQIIYEMAFSHFCWQLD